MIFNLILIFFQIPDNSTHEYEWSDNTAYDFDISPRRFKQSYPACMGVINENYYVTSLANGELGIQGVFADQVLCDDAYPYGHHPSICKYALFPALDGHDYDIDDVRDRI